MLSQSDAREAAVGAGVLRVGGDRLAEGGERQVVIEVVDVVGGLRAKRVRRRIGARRRRRRATSSDGAARRRGRLAGGVIAPILRRGTTLRRLCLLHTIALAYGQNRHSSGRRARARRHVRHDHGEHHEELGFWRKYVFSVDHKVIGIQYTITGLLFLLFGFTLMMIMRWQLAYPGRPIPLIGSWLGQDQRADAASCCPSSTTSSARCTAPSWCSSASCRWPSAASATSSCRCRSARPTWRSPSST